MEDRYLTEKEVSEITGLAVATLRSHRFYRKGIPFCKIGKAVRYSYKTVFQYMEKNTVTFDASAA